MAISFRRPWAECRKQLLEGRSGEYCDSGSNLKPNSCNFPSFSWISGTMYCLDCELARHPLGAWPSHTQILTNGISKLSLHIVRVSAISIKLIFPSSKIIGSKIMEFLMLSSVTTQWAQRLRRSFGRLIYCPTALNLYTLGLTTKHMHSVLVWPFTETIQTFQPVWYGILLYKRGDLALWIVSCLTKSLLSVLACVIISCIGYYF